MASNVSPSSMSSSGFSQSLHDSFTISSNSAIRKTSERSIGSSYDLDGFPSYSHTITSAKSVESAKRTPITPQNFVPLHSEFGSSQHSVPSPLLGSPISKPPLPTRNVLQQAQRQSDICGGITSIYYKLLFRKIL